MFVYCFLQRMMRQYAVKKGRITSVVITKVNSSFGAKTIAFDHNGAGHEAYISGEDPKKWKAGDRASVYYSHKYEYYATSNDGRYFKNFLGMLVGVLNCIFRIHFFVQMLTKNKRKYQVT